VLSAILDLASRQDVKGKARIERERPFINLQEVLREIGKSYSVLTI
jgi:hypothetical protein